MLGIAKALLPWFEQHRRVLPFRQDPTPYHIWISEIMLQQTRMTAAVPYYERFVAELPDPAALAACDPDRLRKLWQGLGYYSRAANLQKAAKLLCQQYGGELPADYNALRALPGIGDYTAGAIASIGFGLPAPAVDGNVLRVFARLYNDDADVTRPDTKRLFTARVMEEQPADRPGDFNQALMELGALVCLPNGAPQCSACPLAALCRGRTAGRAEQLPVKPAKKPRPVLPLTAVVVSGPGGVLLQKRPDRGLLAKLWQPLLWEGALSRAQVADRLADLGLPAGRLEPLGGAKHIFTHKVWQMQGWLALTDACALPGRCAWVTAEALETAYSVPSAFAAFRPAMVSAAGTGSVLRHRTHLVLAAAADPDTLQSCLAVRRAVFTRERGIPAGIETDGHDRLGVGYDHFLVRVDGQNVAAMRCHRQGDAVILQRFCVLAMFRGQGIGRAALAALEAHYTGQARRILLDAKCEAQGFYAACGYRPVSGIFEEAGINHVRMEKLL